MKKSHVTLIYWTSPLLAAALQAGLFRLLDFLFFSPTATPGIGSVLPYIVFIIAECMFAIIGYIICTLYKISKYHASVLIIAGLFFLSMDVITALPMVQRFDYEQSGAVTKIIPEVLKGFLIWLSYPLLLYPLIYVTGKRRSKICESHKTTSHV